MLSRAPEFRYDPADVPSLRRQIRGLPGGERLHDVAMDEILVGPEVLWDLSRVVRQRRPERILLVMDGTPMRRGPDDLKSAVRRALAQIAAPLDELVLLPDPDGEVHASIANAGRVCAAIAPGTVVVCLGSGTVTDTAKHGCFLYEAAPPGRRTALVAIQTANTVTAFTSNMAVLLKDGVKRTLPSRFPDVLICDLQVLADAPLPMTRAGVGDMTAKFTCYGDWYLGHALGMAPTYSEAPLALWEDIDRLLLPHADAIGRGTPLGTAVLAKLLLLSGMGKSIVGLTTPLSGFEHVISHVLDMSAEHHGRRLALHGAQVGVIAIHAAAAWQILLDEFDPARAPQQIPVPDAGAMAGRIRAAFGEADPSGAMAAECWSDYRQKLAAWAEQQAAWTTFLAGWEGTIKQRLRQLLLPPEEIARVLLAVGAPVRFSELDPAIAPEQARFAFETAHLIRKRFSVGDLLYFLGYAGAAWTDRVFARAAHAVAGLTPA